MLAPSFTVKAVCTTLALSAGSISISVAALTGWQNGNALEERALWAMTGIVAVLAAHLLPAIGQHVHGCRWAMVLAMWATCIAYSIYGHATYFSLTLQEAGMRRAQDLPVAPVQTTAQRALSAVLKEEAHLQGQLAKLTSGTCSECPRVKGRIAEIMARIDALHAEAGEVRYDQSRRDRTEQLRDQRRENPVMTAVATWVGVTPAQLMPAPALVFAVILDGLACLCWLLLSHKASTERDVLTPVAAVRVQPVASIAPVKAGESPTPAATSPGRRVAVTVMQSTPDMVMPVTVEKVTGSLPVAANEEIPAKKALTPSRERELHALVHKVETARAAGLISKLTVIEIRAYLGCRQEIASAVARAIKDARAMPIGHVATLEGRIEERHF